MSDYYRKTRHVDTAGGNKVYAVADGATLCDGKFLEGRQIDVQEGLKVYASASECCQPPVNPIPAGCVMDPLCYDADAYTAALNTSPFMVEKDDFLPQGISRVVRVTLEAAIYCDEKDLYTAFLIYDPGAVSPNPNEAIPSGRGGWVGCVGKVKIMMWVNPDHGEEALRVCLYGCFQHDPADIPPMLSLPFDPACTLRIDATIGPGEINVQGCCDNECSPEGLFRVDFHFTTFCGPYHLARHVDTRDGTKVYAVAEPCTQDGCTPTPNICCNTLYQCDLFLTITGGSCIDGTHTLIPDEQHQFGFPMGWKSSSISGCGRTWIIGVTCSPDPDMVDVCDWTMTAESEEVDCSCYTTDSPITRTGRPCFPVDIDVGCTITCNPFPDPPTPGCDGSQTAPAGFTATITV